MDGSDQETGFGTTFLPVVDSHTGLVQALYCRPHFRRQDGALMEDAALLAAGTTGKVLNEALILRTLQSVVGAGIRRAQQLVGPHRTLKVIIPVHGTALIHRDIASEFTALCRTVRKDVHQRIVFEVTGLTDNHRLSFIDDIAIILFPFCVAYHVRTPVRIDSASIYATCNYSAISIDLGNRPWPPDEVDATVTKFFDTADAARLKGYVHGIGTAALAHQIMATGRGWLSGAGVSGPEPGQQRA